MSARAEPYDPDLEEVLRDIATDPRAKLFTLPTSGDLVRLAREEPVSAAAPGLTAAERHLLRVYREEVAYLLRERCLIQLYSAQDADLLFHRNVRVGEQLVIPEEADWSERAGRVPPPPEGEAQLREGMSLIHAHTGMGRGRKPSVDQMALVSLRVRESCTARIHLAMSLVQRRRWREAFEVYKVALNTTSDPLCRSYALEGAAVCLSFSQQPSKALDTFALAAHADASRSNPIMNLIAMSLALDRVESAREYCDRLEDSTLPWDPELHRFASAVNRSTYHASEQLVESLRRNARRLVGTGPSSEVILDAVKG